MRNPIKLDILIQPICNVSLAIYRHRTRGAKAKFFDDDELDVHDPFFDPTSSHSCESELLHRCKVLMKKLEEVVKQMEEKS